MNKQYITRMEDHWGLFNGRQVDRFNFLTGGFDIGIYYEWTDFHGEKVVTVEVDQVDINHPDLITETTKAFADRGYSCRWFAHGCWFANKPELTYTLIVARQPVAGRVNA